MYNKTIKCYEIQNFLDEIACISMCDRQPTAFMKHSKKSTMKNLQFLIGILFFALLCSCNDDFDSVGSFEEDPAISDRHRTCGSDEQMSLLLSDPAFKKEYDQRMKNFEQMNQKRVQKAQCNDPVIIPVAVHYQGANTNQRACLVALAQNQVDILNNDFAGTNSDIDKWTGQAAGFFPGVSHGEACLRFVIADQNHPNGSNLQDGEPAVTINQTNGDRANAWSGYMNIIVQPNTGLLGFAPLGGAGNGDAVVVDASAFGVGNGCGTVRPEGPFDLGRTLTHEVGHYFLLDHIWGNGCNRDDDVADTPNQASDHSGCPQLGVSSCGSNDMHMNYMDYVNDACMYMFSGGQALRMENYAAANLTNLINNASNVIGNAQGGGSTDGPSGNDDNTGDTTDDSDNDDSTDDSSNDDTDTTGDICESPQSSTVTGQSATSVLIDWADMPDVIRFRIRYREAGTRRWTILNATDSEVTLSGLTAQASYQYQLRTRCVQGWTPYAGIETFDLSGGTDGDDNGTDGVYTLRLTLDDYGSETTWYVLDEDFNEIHTGGPYQDGRAGQVITREFELSEGCYELELQDSYGDGICCDYGDGFAEILDANGRQVVSLDGRFGRFDYVGFCVDGNGLRIVRQNRDTKLKSLKKK